MPSCITIETAFRSGKSEVAMESPCLRIWEQTLKLLALVTLVYAFLLYLLQETFEHSKNYLLGKSLTVSGGTNRSPRGDLSRLFQIITNRTYQ